MAKCLVTRLSSVINNDSLPKIIIIDDDTKDAMSIYKSATDSQKYAFARFINKIGGFDGSIYDKIYYLAIPNFGSSTKEQLKNVKTKSYDSAFITDDNVDTMYAHHDGYVSTVTPQIITFDPVNAASNSVFMIANLEGSTGRFASLNSGNFTISIYPSVSPTIPLTSSTNANYKPTSGTYNYPQANKVMLFGNINNGATINCYAISGEKLISDNSVAFSGDVKNISSAHSFGAGGSSINTVAKHYLLGYANGLTKEEMIILYDALVELSEFMGA